MHAVLLALVLCADPSPALKSLAGLNVPSLKPWLMEQLPTLAQCALPLVKEGTEEVSVQAQFGKSPEVSVMRVEATLSDVACVRGVVEKWKRDAKQPSAGPFRFTYRFKPNAAQREAITAKAQRAFAKMCPKLPEVLTAVRVREAIDVDLPMGARVSLEDALTEAESLPPAKFSVAISRTLRDLAAALGVEQCVRTGP